MAAGKLITPTDGMVIRSNTTLTPGVYHLPNGLRIETDGIVLDGNGAVLVGSDHEGSAVRLEGRSSVTIKNFRIRDYYHGIYARGGSNLTIANNHITATAEVPPNTIFLDIWRGAEDAYGGGIFLW